jgi:hypothetical protein
LWLEGLRGEDYRRVRRALAALFGGAVVDLHGAAGESELEEIFIRNQMEGIASIDLLWFRR